MKRYQVLVECYAQKTTRSVWLEAREPMLACEAAERRVAMDLDGSLERLDRYFAAQVVGA